MINDLNMHLPPIVKPSTPVFRPLTNSTSNFFGVHRGTVLMTDEKDDKKRGRLKIYVPGAYPDITIREAKDLPWAYPEQPAMLGGKYQQGWTSVPEVMSTVLVRFDCGNVNFPLYVGTVPGVQHKIKGGDANNSEPMHGKADDSATFDKPDKHESDIHRYSDAKTAKIDYNTKLQKDLKPTENTPPAFGGEDRWSTSWAKQHGNITYPYNHIFSTGKHTIEFDNTDGYERLAIAHGNGSHFSIDWSGDHIAEAKGHIWNTAMKSIVSSTEKNKVDMAKQHKASIVQGDSITTVGGRTEVYFGKTVTPANMDIDYDATELVSKVQVKPLAGGGFGGNSGSGGSDKGTYMEFSGDADMKMAQAFTHEVDKSYGLMVKEKMDVLVKGDMALQSNGKMSLSGSTEVNIQATVIKLNCGSATPSSPKTMKGGGAGGAGGTGASSVPAKQPSPTVNDRTTERNTALLASIIAQVDAPVISKYDNRSKGECDKI